MYSVFILSSWSGLRDTSKTLVIFRHEKKSYVSMWNLIQRFAEYAIYKRKKIGAAFLRKINCHPNW